MHESSESERTVEPSGLTNIRDLGGIIVDDGRHVAKGVLARSEALGNATDEDLERITAMFDLKVIVDFRTEDEYAQQPDPLDRMPGARLIHAPILNPASMGGSEDEGLDPETIIRRFCGDSAEFMGRMYRDMMLQERGRTGYAEFFETLLQTDEGAVLWHCTSGKDRTGIASALLLHVLGASAATIRNDYLAVNRLLDPHREQVVRSCREMGLDERTIEVAVHASCAVEATYLQAAFAAIEEGYDSVDGYLVNALRVTPDAQATLRERYLA